MSASSMSRQTITAYLRLYLKKRQKSLMQQRVNVIFMLIYPSLNILVFKESVKWIEQEFGGFHALFTLCNSGSE